MKKFFSTHEGVASYKQITLEWVPKLPNSEEMLAQFGVTSKYSQAFDDFLEKSYPQFYQSLTEKEPLSVEKFHSNALTYYKKSGEMDRIIQIAENLLKNQLLLQKQTLYLMNEYSKRLSQSITGKLGTTIYDRHSDGHGLTEYEHGTLSMINMAFSSAIFEDPATPDRLAKVVAAFFHDSGRLINSNREQGHADHHRLGARLIKPLGSIAEKTALLHTTIPKYILCSNESYQRLLSGESALSRKVQLNTKALEEAKKYLKDAENPDEIVLDTVAKRIIVDELAKMPRGLKGYPLAENSQIETLIGLQLRLNFLKLTNDYGKSEATTLFKNMIQESIEIMSVDISHSLQM